MLKALLIGCAVMATAATVAVAQPKIEVIGGETFDWGKVKPPKEGYLEATIKMKNVGTEVLKLTEIRPGCGCTKTDPDKTELKPGEVSTMGVKLNIGPMQSGPLTKSITVRSNSAGADSVKYLFLKADVVRALALSPSIYFSFTDLKVGQESTTKVDVMNNDAEPITISDFTADNGLVLNVTGKKVIKPGEKLELIAKTIPQAKGSYQATVTFKTSHPDHPTMEIKAYGMVMDTQSPVYQATPKN